jgi:hypothetical protein
MLEHVLGPRRRSNLSNEITSLQFLNVLGQSRVALKDSMQQRVRKTSPDHGCLSEGLLYVRFKTVDAGHNDALNGGRYRDLVDMQTRGPPAGRSVARNGALMDQRPYQFLDKQRIPIRSLQDRVAE